MCTENNVFQRQLIIVFPQYFPHNLREMIKNFVILSLTSIKCAQYLTYR